MGVRLIESARYSQSSHPSHHLIPSLSSPLPLSPALFYLLALNNPPPPGVGGADEQTVCDCGRGVDLLASRHATPLSRSRSLATAIPVIAAVPSAACFVIAPVAHHACGSCHPRLPPRPACRGTGRGYGLAAGCGLFGCHRLVACLPHAVSTPRTIWLSPISSPSPREVCFHACADGGSFGCGADAMRSPLPASPFKRFNCF